MRTHSTVRPSVRPSHPFIAQAATPQNVRFFFRRQPANQPASQQKGSEVYNESDMMRLLLVLGGCGWYSSSQLNDMERRRMKLNDRFLITTTLGPDLILFRECFLPHRHSFIHSQSPHAHTWNKYTTYVE